MDDDKLDLILQELKEHGEQFKTINKRLEIMDKRLETMDKQLKIMDKRLKNIENVVNKGVYEDITRLEKRIEAIEQKQAI